MDQQIVARTITLMGVVGTPFLLLALWHTKQASRLSWKIYSVSCLIVCGGAFLAGFLLSGVTDTVFSCGGPRFPVGPAKLRNGSEDRDQLAGCFTSGAAGRLLSSQEKHLNQNAFRVGRELVVL